MSYLNNTYLTTGFIFVTSVNVPLLASTAVPAPTPSPLSASDAPVSGDKPARSKAELKAERRARQEADRVSKQIKKGEVSQPVPTGKPKIQPSELQPGTLKVIIQSSYTQNRRESH